MHSASRSGIDDEATASLQSWVPYDASSRLAAPSPIKQCCIRLEYYPKEPPAVRRACQKFSVHAFRNFGAYRS